MASAPDSRKPNIPVNFMRSILLQHYDLDIEVSEELKSFSAQNYVVTVLSGDDTNKKLLVKIMNLEEEDEILEGRFQVMDNLRKEGFVCQLLVRTVEGKISAPASYTKKQGDAFPYKVCVLEYLEGRELFHLAPWQPELLRAVGHWLAELRIGLQLMTIPALSQENNGEEFYENVEWKLLNLSDSRRHYDSLESGHQSATETVIKHFEETVLPVVDQLPTGLIHADLHDENILLLPGSTASEWDDVKLRFGLIDFEDVHQSRCIIDLATALCYFMIACRSVDILSVSGNILSGYQKKVMLSSVEWTVLYSLVCGRYIQELVLCEVELKKQSGNEYLKTCFQDGWPQIEQLINWGEEYVVKVWQKYL